MTKKSSKKNCFIKSLMSSINKHKEISIDSSKFINYKQLYLYNFGKKYINVTEDDLPTNVILGSAYLIKKNNILEIYSWCDAEYSLYIQANIKRPAWIGNIDIINTDNNDTENIKYILNGADIFDDPDLLQYLAVQFINNGFSLYLPK